MEVVALRGFILGMGKTWKAWILFLGVLTACSSEAPPFTDCRLGELTGTWRAHYTETNGDCGPIPDETAVFSPGKQDPATAGCKTLTATTSADRCRMDLDWTCPPAKGSGTVRWTGVLRHTGRDTLAADLSLQINIPAGYCRSTYLVTMTRL